jgi:hypothetical protein
LIDRQLESQQVKIGERPDAGKLLIGPGQPDDGQQHEQTSGHGKQKELDGGVDPALASPDADDEIHRHQHDLPEDIEKK